MNLYDYIADNTTHRKFEDVLIINSMINYWVSTGRIGTEICKDAFELSIGKSSYVMRCFYINFTPNRNIWLYTTAATHKITGDICISVTLAIDNSYKNNKNYILALSPYETFLEDMRMLDNELDQYFTKSGLNA